MRLRLVLRVALLALLASGAQAQNYPAKPITMIVPFSAGGPTDTLGCPIAKAMTVVKLRVAELGTEPVAQRRATPEALKAHLRAEIEKWGLVIKKAGQYAD